MAVDIQNNRSTPQARKGVKKAALFMCGGQGKNCVSNKTQMPYANLSLALRTTPQNDLFPSAILKEMNAMKDWFGIDLNAYT